uniref:Uncharacterized protein n=1 Tax=Anguilla anguilla TaxID=7936 RepID=A0A0E9P855_ANGAN
MVREHVAPLHFG